MASPYPPFIFQDAVPAQQMMAHAQAVNEGMRIAELGKARQAEGLFRIAQLQQQQKAQQEKNALDRMIAESQIEQARIGSEFQNRELNQRATLTREGYKRDIDVAGIRARDLDPREAIAAERERYDRELAQKEEAQDAILMQEWQALEAEANNTQAKLNAPKPGDGFLGIGRGPYNARLEEDKQSQAVLGRIRQRQQLIEAILSQRGKVPSTRTTQTQSPPRISDLLPPAPADPRIDAIKRDAAAAIQRGANPAEVYRRMEQMGVPIR